MRRKEQVRKAGTILLIAGAGAVGILVGVILFLTNPDLIPVPTSITPTPTLLPAVQLPTNTPAPRWIVTYEYRFSPEVLTPGTHEYEMGVGCPAGLGSGTYQGSFTISQDAPLQQNRVYIRTNGIWNSAVGGNQLNAINPQQAVGAALSLRYNTLDQAETARENCKVSVGLDLSQPVRMDPSLPKEE